MTESIKSVIRPNSVNVLIGDCDIDISRVINELHATPNFRYVNHNTVVNRNYVDYSNRVINYIDYLASNNVSGYTYLFHQCIDLVHSGYIKRLASALNSLADNNTVLVATNSYPVFMIVGTHTQNHNIIFVNRYDNKNMYSAYDTIGGLSQKHDVLATYLESIADCLRTDFFESTKEENKD